MGDKSPTHRCPKKSSDYGLTVTAVPMRAAL